MKKTTTTINTSSATTLNEIKGCPLTEFMEMREALITSIQSTTIYRETLRKAACAALDNYVSTWETPEQPRTFRAHVVSVGQCDALEVLKEWCLVTGGSLGLLLAEHPYFIETANEQLAEMI